MLTFPLFQSDPNRSKSFPEGSTVVLLRDYIQASHNLTLKFSQNDCCFVTECGLSEYVYDEKRKRFQKIDGGPEWCGVDLSDGEYDPPLSCCVKAEDLRELTKEEYDQI